MASIKCIRCRSDGQKLGDLDDCKGCNGKGYHRLNVTKCTRCRGDGHKLGDLDDCRVCNRKD